MDRVAVEEDARARPVAMVAFAAEPVLGLRSLIRLPDVGRTSGTAGGSGVGKSEHPQSLGRARYILCSIVGS